MSSQIGGAPCERSASRSAYRNGYRTRPWDTRVSSGGTRKTRRFGELLIDLEEDKAARAVVFGLLRDMERK